MFMNSLIFSPIRLIPFIDPPDQKIAVGSCQSTKIDTFLCQIPSMFDPWFLPNFSSHFKLSFKILTTGTKEGNVQD